MNKKPIAMFFAGLTIGAVAVKLIPPQKPIGNLRIDESDPEEEPYMFLELNQNVGDIRKKHTVTLNVLDQNYVSAK